MIGFKLELGKVPNLFKYFVSDPHNYGSRTLHAFTSLSQPAETKTD